MSTNCVNSPDGSGKPFFKNDYFLLKEKSDQRKLLLFHCKKRSFKKSLQRTAGIASNKKEKSFVD